jgi:hypothetical protein
VRLTPQLVLLPLLAAAAAGCHGHTAATSPMPGTVASTREDRAIVLVQTSVVGGGFGFFPRLDRHRRLQRAVALARVPLQRLAETATAAQLALRRHPLRQGGRPRQHR